MLERVNVSPAGRRLAGPWADDSGYPGLETHRPTGQLDRLRLLDGALELVAELTVLDPDLD